MTILQIEMNMEASRQSRLAAVKDPEEAAKLEVLFEQQRDACVGRIEGIKADYRELIREKVGKLVRYKKVGVKVGVKKGVKGGGRGGEEKGGEKEETPST